MMNFVTIMRFDDGMASYQVNETKNSYKAELLRSTSQNSLPAEVTIKREVAIKSVEENDPIMKKLISAIKTAESNQEF